MSAGFVLLRAVGETLLDASFLHCGVEAGFWQPLAFLGLCVHHCGLSLHVYVAFSLVCMLLFVSTFSLFISVPVILD